MNRFLSISLTVLLSAVSSTSLADDLENSAPSFKHRLNLEYRTQFVGMRPLSLNDFSASKVSYLDQRARIGARFLIGEHVKLRTSIDFLDGVLFGDNGSFTGTPMRNRGSVVGSKGPNLARLNIGQIDPNAGALNIENYGYVLEEAEVMRVRMIFGEARLPFGLLRAGRQSITSGRNILVHEGTRINRWGISKAPDVVDGIAFGTKLSAIYDAMLGSVIDSEPDQGLFLGVLYGQIVENLPQQGGDLYQLASTVFYKGEQVMLLGHEIPRFDAGLVLTNRFQDTYKTDLYNFTGYFIFETSNFLLSAFHTHMIGSTREISEGLSLLGTRLGKPGAQDILAFGGWIEIAYRLKQLEFVFEFFYASGDDTPGVQDPINQLTFAQDTNVGLHLFENVLHYQTARSAARGVASLHALNANTFPANEVNSYGGLQNALVFFPQVVYSPLEWADFRFGVLFAYTHLPAVDPIATILNSSGSSLEDDKVNFNGGKPGDYWGTEVDVGLTLKPVPGFLIDLEAAYLFSGNAFWDEHEDAADSVFGNIRMTYFYDS